MSALKERFLGRYRDPGGGSGRRGGGRRYRSFHRSAPGVKNIRNKAVPYSTLLIDPARKHGFHDQWPKTGRRTATSLGLSDTQMSANGTDPCSNDDPAT